MEETKFKYAKTADFEVPRHTKILGFKRVPASKFGDKDGQTYRLTFEDLRTDEKYIYENSSYIFYRDFRSAKLTGNDEVVIYSVKF